MAEESEKKDANGKIVLDFTHKFESKLEDPGMKYVENFNKRKFETLISKDIIKALEHAAINGNPENPEQDKLEFVQSLLIGELVFKTSSAERKAIFKKAAAQAIEEPLVIKSLDND